MQEIKVAIVEFGDRKHYQRQFRDPVTGRKKTRSTGTERTGMKCKRTEAGRVAAKLEAELPEGCYHAADKTTRADFRERYNNEALPQLSGKTAKKVQTTFDLVEGILNRIG